MIPKPEDFAKYVHDIAGIQNNHHIIIYDNSERFGLFSAPRCWYLFRVMGHKFVHILDGGLPKWVKDGFEVASGDYSKSEELPGKFYISNHISYVFYIPHQKRILQKLNSVMYELGLSSLKLRGKTSINCLFVL